MTEIGVPPALTDAVESLKDSVSAGRTDIFRKLLEACETCDGGGPEERKQLVDALTNKDGTFLHMATKLGHSDIVRALLATGADPGILDRSGNTPYQVSPSPAISAIYIEDLLRATARSEIGRVCQLIASGLSVNSYDNPLNKNTPLHWAASFTDVDTLECLIARGANVNNCNSSGISPLHDAITRGDPAIVEALLQHGANPHIRCHKSRHTAYEMAQKKTELRDLIEKYPKENFTNGIINGVCNGSASPVLARTALSGRGGSMESLTSIGTDSVMTTSVDVRTSSQTPLNKAKFVRAQSLTSVGEETGRPILARNGNNRRARRSPLESTSSLEFSPNMEQVCERLAATQLSIPPRRLVTNSSLHGLWPQPKRIIELSDHPWRLPKITSLAIAPGSVPVHQVVDVWNIHREWLDEVGCMVQLGCIMNPCNYSSCSSSILCTVNSSLVQSEGHYTITIKETGVWMACGSLEALHNALVTLTQVLRVFQEANDMDRSADRETGSLDASGIYIPSLVIMDYPSLPNRGLVLDMAPQARIPSLERVCQIVDCLVALKMNQLHLMFKISPTHSLSSSKPCRGGELKCCCQLPFTSSELVSLERYCSDRGISLIPGFDIESPSSASHFTQKDYATALSLALANFSSAKFIHLGPGLTSSLAELSHNSDVSPWVELHLPNSTILMLCANVFHDNASALKRLPMSSVLVEYGFQADYDFSRGCRLALEEGRPLAICPGTAAWSSLSGWPEAGVSNVYSGVVSSLESSASWLLVAHWSNTASLTPMAFTWPPLFVASGLAWNHNTHWDFVHSSVGSLIDKHLVKLPDCGLGDALIELGRCETWLTRIARDQPSNDPKNLPSSSPGSTLHQLLSDPDSVVLDNLTTDAFAVVMKHVRRAVKEGAFPKKREHGHNSSPRSLSQVASLSKWPMATLIVMELQLAMEMILAACRIGRSLVLTGTNPRSNMGMSVVNPGVANLPPTVRTDLANKVLALREVYSSVWLHGQLAPGLQTSLLVFTSLLSRLLPEQTLHNV